MAHTDVTLKNDFGKFAPSLSRVAVVEGDTVSFTTSDGGTAFLFFSPDAAAALSPTPSDAYEVSGAEGVTFTFTVSDEGAYGVFFEATPTKPQRPFPRAQSNELLLEIDGWGHFGGPFNPINTSGHSSDS